MIFSIAVNWLGLLINLRWSLYFNYYSNCGLWPVKVNPFHDLLDSKRYGSVSNRVFYILYLVSQKFSAFMV